MSSLTLILTHALLLIGSFFLLVSAVGVVRMPDLFSRIQAAAKASTLGVGSIVLALAVWFGGSSLTIRAFLVIAFLFLTAPVAVQVIGRAAYFIGIPMWKGTVLDELSGRYDPLSHRLSSSAPDDTSK